MMNPSPSSPPPLEAQPPSEEEEPQPSPALEEPHEVARILVEFAAAQKAPDKPEEKNYEEACSYGATNCQCRALQNHNMGLS